VVTPSPSIRPKAGFGRLGRGLECCCSHGDHEPHHTACLRGKARLTCAADIGNRTSESSRGCGRAEEGPSSIGPRCLFSAAINCRPSKGKWSICVLVQHQFITLGSSWLALTTSKSWNRATNGLLRAQVRVPSRQRIARSLARMLI
jgi:hypothetical protein